MVAYQNLNTARACQKLCSAMAFVRPLFKFPLRRVDDLFKPMLGS